MSEYQIQTNVGKIEFQVPSQYQFYTLSLQNYMELTLKKIEAHLNSNPNNLEPVQKSKYYKLSNEQLRRRASYLQIVLALMSVYNQISCQLSPRTLQQVSKTNKCIILPLWLNKLKLNNEQLSRIARIKASIQEEMNIEYFNRKLIGLLFQTEIYILQILIRLIIVQRIHSQTDKYNSELRKLKSKFDLSHPTSKQGKQQEIIINEIAMPKSAEMRCKQLFKQINKILTYYQLEISMNRPNCTIKPQLQYLIQFVQYVFNKELISQIFKRTELGRFSLQMKQSKKDSIFVPAAIVLSKDLKQTQNLKQITTNKQNLITQSIFQAQEINRQSQQLLSINNQDSNKPSQSSCGFIEQANKNQTKKNKELNTQNAAIKAKVVIHESSMSEKSNRSSRQRQSAVSVYLKQKSNKFDKVISEYSQYKKLQYISSNQRFSGRFNLHNKLFKSKDKASQDFSNFHLEARYQNDKLRRETISKQKQLLQRAGLISDSDEILKEQRTPFYDKQND